MILTERSALYIYNVTLNELGISKEVHFTKVTGTQTNVVWTRVTNCF